MYKVYALISNAWMRTIPLLLSLVSSSFLAACGGELSDDTPIAEGTLATRLQPLFAGVNGEICTESPYNCRLRDGNNRVVTDAPDDDNKWGLLKGGPVRDGNGGLLIYSTMDSTTFNYGQSRIFDGETYVFAVATSNRSAGWMPLSSIKGKDSFERKVDHISAKGAGLSEMGCYAVRNWHDPTLELKKVVYDSKMDLINGHERAGDYLPLVRANGRRSANLAFNVPGFDLGGVAIDHFPAGTKFRRFEVPTNSGLPSIEIPLWVNTAHDPRFRTQSGTMKFIYGRIVSATGTVRNGWMALDALEVSSGCP